MPRTQQRSRPDCSGRQWFPTRKAAEQLGISERTLRRRTSQCLWVEGLHYRWVTRLSRRTLEINVPRAINLMEQSGWCGW